MEANPIHIGQCILLELHNQHKSVRWLAQQLDVERANCYRILRTTDIKTDRLYLISQLLHRDFFAVYSQELAQTKK